jgi:hypothetical protein
MNAVATESVFTRDDYLPPSTWGKDHWSTLAYAETVMTECGGFQLGLDPRMRMSRKTYRVMSDCPSPKRHSSTLNLLRATRPLEPGDGTRLKDSSTVSGHDDYACLEDMAQLGFFDLGPVGFKAGKTLRLSELGRKVTSALRSHKQDGHNFADFQLSTVVPESDLVPLAQETYTWMRSGFDITGILQAYRSGSIRCKIETWNAEEIASMAIGLFALDINEPMAKKYSIIGSIDPARVAAMPESVFEMPLVLAYVGKNKGCLNLDGTGPHYVLIDGNHRLGKAFFTRRKSVNLIKLSQAQVRPFKD